MKISTVNLWQKTPDVTAADKNLLSIISQRLYEHQYLEKIFCYGIITLVRPFQALA